jgi:hypothetical protein
MAAIENLGAHLAAKRFLKVRKHGGGSGNSVQPQSVPIASRPEEICDGLPDKSLVSASSNYVQKLTGLGEDTGAEEKHFADVREACRSKLPPVEGSQPNEPSLFVATGDEEQMAAGRRIAAPPETIP